MLSGNSHNGRLAEIIELPDHPFFIAGPVPPRAAVAPHPAAPVVPRVRAARRRRTPGARRADRTIVVG